MPALWLRRCQYPGRPPHRSSKRWREGWSREPRAHLPEPPRRSPLLRCKAQQARSKIVL